MRQAEKRKEYNMKKEEFRQELAEKFLTVLESKGEETLEWVKRWKGDSKAPRNGITKIKYKGINMLNLYLTSEIKGYKDPRWYTMNQIKDLKDTYHKKEKWHLKAGTKGTWIEYWSPYDVKAKKSITWEECKQRLHDPEFEYTLFPKYSCVFNADCIEGISEFKPDENCNQEVLGSDVIDIMSERMGVPIVEDGGDKAYYSPSDDEIHLPKKTCFESSEAYAATALHELCHATGHESRLNRDLKNVFGSDKYAFEELVAEMASAFSSFNISSEISDENLKEHKAYIKSWSISIRNEPGIFAKAIKEAQKAAEYLDNLLKNEKTSVC